MKRSARGRAAGVDLLAEEARSMCFSSRFEELSHFGSRNEEIDCATVCESRILEIHCGNYMTRHAVRLLRSSSSNSSSTRSRRKTPLTRRAAPTNVAASPRPMQQCSATPGASTSARARDAAEPESEAASRTLRSRAAPGKGQSSDRNAHDASKQRGQSERKRPASTFICSQ